MSESTCRICKIKLLVNRVFQEEDEYSGLCISCYHDWLWHSCHCGATSIGSKYHADYCPRYNLDIEQHPRQLKNSPKE